MNDIFQCVDPGLRFHDKGIYLANGSHGLIFKYKTSVGPVVIKYIFDVLKTKKTVLGPDDNAFLDEIKYSYEMSALGIGPKVYDAFFYDINFSDIKKYPDLHAIYEQIMKNKYSNFSPYADLLKASKAKTARRVLVQCLVMGHYEENCYDAAGSMSGSAVKQMLHQIKDLVAKQIDIGLYCFDVKLNNFIINYDKHTGKMDTKMIDFDFCMNKSVFPGYKMNQTLPGTNGFTLTNMLYVSNIAQILSQLDQCYDSIDYFLEVFKHDSVLAKFVKLDYRKIVVTYFKYGQACYEAGASTPAWMCTFYLRKSGEDPYTKANMDYATKKFISFMDGIKKVIEK
jgi:hypothetical protein